MLGGEHGTAVPEHVLSHQSTVRRRGAGRGRGDLSSSCCAPTGGERAHRCPEVKGIAFRSGDGVVGPTGLSARHGVTSMRSRCRTGTRSRSPTTSSGTRRTASTSAGPSRSLGDPRVPVPVHVLLEPRDVDAALDQRAIPSRWPTRSALYVRKYQVTNFDFQASRPS